LGPPPWSKFLKKNANGNTQQLAVSVGEKTARVGEQRKKVVDDYLLFLYCNI